MEKVNDYIVQEEIFNNYIVHKYNTNKIEELSRKYVYHDEHISVGYNLGYLYDVYCICKDRQESSKEYKHYFVVGEDVNLNRFCNEAKQKKYILDIDLDFFNSSKDFEVYEEMLKDLIKGTDIITIAREHSYFDYLCENMEWTNDVALQKIIDLIVSE